MQMESLVGVWQSAGAALPRPQNRRVPRGGSGEDPLVPPHLSASAQPKAAVDVPSPPAEKPPHASHAVAGWELLQRPPYTVGLLTNFGDTPHWWVSFERSPAWLESIPSSAIGSCAELAIPAPWLLWTGAKDLFHLSIRRISASGSREARLGECVPHRCGWEAHSTMYIPVSCSGIQWLPDKSVLTTGSLLTSSRGPRRGRRK